MNDRIRKAREYAGLTQGQLADAVGVSRRQVNRWESGDREPSAKHATAIADATGVTVNFLLGDFPRLPTTWAPLIVVATEPEREQTAEYAAELIGRATGDDQDLEDVADMIQTGWITWENGAVVQWQDGDRDEHADELFRMLVK